MEVERPHEQQQSSAGREAKIHQSFFRGRVGFQTSTEFSTARDGSSGCSTRIGATWLRRLKDRDMALSPNSASSKRGLLSGNMMISGVPKFQKDPDTQSLLPMEKNVQTVSQAVEGKWFCLPLLQIAFLDVQ